MDPGLTLVYRNESCPATGSKEEWRNCMEVALSTIGSRQQLSRMLMKYFVWQGSPTNCVGKFRGYYWPERVFFICIVACLFSQQAMQGILPSVDLNLNLLNYTSQCKPWCKSTWWMH